jgi:mannose-6-phosphate isomerase-like protein (cupin superfamily)
MLQYFCLLCTLMQLGGEDVSTPMQQQPFILGAEDGPAYWYVNNRAVIKASAEQTGGAFSIVEMYMEPGHGPPLHVHKREDEVFWVIEGELFVRTGDHEALAGPGSCIYAPRGVPHTFRVESATPPRVLVLLCPGGGEGFFIDSGRPAEGPGMPPLTVPDFSLLEEIAGRYNQDFVGPPL